MSRNLRSGIHQAYGDDVLDDITIVECRNLTDYETGCEEDGTEHIEAGDPPTLVVAIVQPSATWPKRNPERKLFLHALVSMVDTGGSESDGKERRSPLIRGIEEDAPVNLTPKG